MELEETQPGDVGDTDDDCCSAEIQAYGKVEADEEAIPRLRLRAERCRLEALFCLYQLAPATPGDLPGYGANLITAMANLIQALQTSVF